MINTNLLKTGILLSIVMLLACACSASKVVKQNVTQDSAFKVVLWSDHEDNTYRTGDDIYLFFTANRDCYLTIYSVNKEGHVRMLLPNQHQKDNIAKAENVYRIPSKNATFKFKAREPIGEETVKAIATLDEIPLYDNKEDNTLDPRNQAEILKQIQTNVMSLETGKWTEYQLQINVVQ